MVASIFTGSHHLLCLLRLSGAPVQDLAQESQCAAAAFNQVDDCALCAVEVIVEERSGLPAGSVPSLFTGIGCLLYCGKNIGELTVAVYERPVGGGEVSPVRST